MSAMNRRKKKNSSTLLFTVVALLFLVLGGALVARVFWSDIQSWFTEEEPVEDKRTEIPPGMVAVPICPRGIPAYKKITRDDLWSPKDQTFAFIAMPEDRIPEDAILKISEIRGRVTRRLKKANYLFTEADFYPKGTREGLVAAIPPGMRSWRVTTKQIRGLHDLRPGDHFDVIASTPVKSKDDSMASLIVDAPSSTLLSASKSNNATRANVKVLVRDGIVINPVRIRAEPTVGASLTQGTFSKTLPVQEVVIALHAHEVTQLAEAFATGAEVWCTARSGRPDGEDEEVEALVSQTPLEKLLNGSEDAEAAMIERISGVERTRRLVMSPHEKEAVASEKEPASSDRGETPAAVIDRK